MAKRVRGSHRPASRRSGGRIARPGQPAAGTQRPAAERLSEALPGADRSDVVETGATEPRADERRSLIEPAVTGVASSGSLTQAELDRAAELEARIVADERAAEAAQRRGATRGRSADPARGLEPLSVRAADEYAYVRRDVLRIARIGGMLLGVLAVLYLLIDVTHTIVI
jgi:hypothetical protein